MKRAEFLLICGTVFLTLLALLVIVPGSGLAAAEIVTLRLMQLAVLFAAFFVFIFCLRGTRYDVLAEVFEQSNVAAAIVVAALLLALSGVIGK